MKTESKGSRAQEDSWNLHERKVKWEKNNPPFPPSLLVHLSDKRKKEFVEGYQKDMFFKLKWDDLKQDPDS